MSKHTPSSTRKQSKARTNYVSTAANVEKDLRDNLVNYNEKIQIRFGKFISPNSSDLFTEAGSYLDVGKLQCGRWHSANPVLVASMMAKCIRTAIEWPVAANY